MTLKVPWQQLLKKIWPGHGYSEYGKLGDQIADSAALAIGGIGIMANKRVHPISRIAMAYISFQEIRKAIQAQKITSEYQAVTQDKSLPDIPTTENGKNSMALKLVAVTAATATSSEKMGFFKRTALAIGSFATAHASVTYADAAQEEYRSYFYNTLLPETQTKFSSEPTLSSTVASFISIPEI